MLLLLMLPVVLSLEHAAVRVLVACSNLQATLLTLVDCLLQLLLVLALHCLGLICLHLEGV